MGYNLHKANNGRRMKKMREANFEVSDTRDIGFIAFGTSAKLLGFVSENIAGPRGLWSREFFY